MTGVGFAKQNVWSRAARRRQRNEDSHGKDTVEDNGSDSDEAALGFSIQAKQRKSAGHAEVVTRWLKGNDAVLFESFCGMLKRQIENR